MGVPFYFCQNISYCMLITEFDYELPDDLIAQDPLEHREASRMMIVDREKQSYSDRRFMDLPSQLREGDILVINNTKVFPARLRGRSETGAQVEIFLVEQREANLWEALARPAKRLHPGKMIEFGEGLSGSVLEKTADGRVVVEFQAAGELDDLIDRHGETPLPPYIKRDPQQHPQDRERYQTVFAASRGAIAAPTAGLHFTSEVLEAIRAQGVEVIEITLHVGYGTFEPVRVDELSDHRVAAERYSISDASAEILNNARTSVRRIVAVGTTTTRALESNLGEHGEYRAGSFLAGLTITPGYRFRAVDALLTNFHLPKSSLLVLTSTFGGHELIMRAYKHAVAENYRFYSYGDCMLIV